MKLIQLNAWGSRLNSNIVELLKNESPDIVCLQEIFSSNKHVGLLLGTLQSMQEDLGYKSEYYSPVFQFKVMNSITQFGNCVLSNLPIKSKGTIFTNLEFVEDFNFEDHDYNVRNMQHVEFEVDGNKLHILNHHGHHVPDHKNGDAVTLRQMKQIAQYIKTLDGAVILSGDFNLSPHSESLGQINKILTNLPVKFNLETTRTNLTHKKEVCDYIFVSKEVKVKDFKAAGEVVSDHQALILEFEI